jgi:GNAT superfamily N-acetyltransferase
MLEKTYQIKLAEAERIDDIVKFVGRMLRELYPPGACNLDPEDLANFKEAYLVREDTCLYVAEDAEGQVIGTAAVRPYDHRFPFLGHLLGKAPVCEMSRYYIDGAYRRQGIGRQLYAKVEAYAQEAGYQGSYLHTSVYLPGGFPFWGSRGYKELHWETTQIVHMHKAL